MEDTFRVLAAYLFLPVVATLVHPDTVYVGTTNYNEPLVAGGDYTIFCEIFTNNTLSDRSYPLQWSHGDTVLTDHVTETTSEDYLGKMVMHYESDYHFTADKSMDGQVLTCTARLTTGVRTSSYTLHIYEGTLCDLDPCGEGEHCYTKMPEPHKYSCFYPPHYDNPGHAYSGPDPCSLGHNVCVNNGRCTYNRDRQTYTCEYDENTWETLVGR